MDDDNTVWQPIEPTTPVQKYPYDPTVHAPNPYEDAIPIPPPPPRKSRKVPVITVGMAFSGTILLFCSAFLFYWAYTYHVNTIQPTPVVIVVTPTMPAPMPTPTVDPNYTASEIVLDMVHAGCTCGADAGYGTTIWDYTNQNYYVHEHATSSATWEDPPQSADGEYVGVWVYVDAATAEEAYTEVGNDQGKGLTHYQWPTEYQHGRCLLLIRSAFGAGAVPWSGYDQVVNQYCV